MIEFVDLNSLVENLFLTLCSQTSYKTSKNDHEQQNFSFKSATKKKNSISFFFVERLKWNRYVRVT